MLQKSLPKTPRAGLKGVAQSTGHVDSPETIVIGRGRRAGTIRTPWKDAELYADMPPTPTPPTLMFVSPMSGGRKGRRKSAMTLARKAVVSPDLKGVRELMKEPKTRKSVVLTGVRELMATTR